MTDLAELLIWLLCGVILYALFRSLREYRESIRAYREFKRRTGR